MALRVVGHGLGLVALALRVIALRVVGHGLGLEGHGLGTHVRLIAGDTHVFEVQ